MSDTLPIHPRTGLRAVGIVAGRPVWPIAGASPDHPGDNADNGTGDSTGDGDQTNGQSGAASNGSGSDGGSGKQQPDTGGKSSGEGDDLSDLDPAALAKMVKDLRAENASTRTNAKQQAADEAKQQMAQDIGKALGLVKGDDDKADPAKLAEQVSAAQQAQQQAAVELAVYKLASKHEADPDALTDSRAFLDKVAKLDPAADDFQAKVGDAIKKAVEANPKLKAAGQAPPRSGAPLPGGSGSKGSTSPKSLNDAVAARYAGNG